MFIVRRQFIGIQFMGRQFIGKEVHILLYINKNYARQVNILC